MSGRAPGTAHESIPREPRNHADFIWSVADLLRGDYKRSEYGKVILPLTVLRRLDGVLAPTKQRVIEEAYNVPSMAYAVGQTVEVCLEFDLPPARGLRRVVATFANERGDVTQLTDVPAGASECVLQEPTQVGLQGQAAYPGFYELKRLRVEDLQGVTPVKRPKMGFQVKATPEVAG